MSSYLEGGWSTVAQGPDVMTFATFFVAYFAHVVCLLPFVAGCHDNIIASGSVNSPFSALLSGTNTGCRGHMRGNTRQEAVIDFEENVAPSSFGHTKKSESGFVQRANAQFES